jgi:hypothetical protein
MDKMTKDLYERYNSEIEWGEITKSVECEMYCALFSKLLTRTQESLNDGRPKPPPYIARMNARIEALIAVSVELTALGLTLMLRENQ